MQFIKYCMLFFVFIISFKIGKKISEKYKYRLDELEEIKNSLNILKNKIKFTYEPIPEIFNDISININNKISQIFIKAREKMENKTANMAWEESIDEFDGNINNQDKRAIKTLSKLLGITDVEGQISQIEITEEFLEKQIKDATVEKEKNEKLYKKLGVIIGLTIITILI